MKIRSLLRKVLFENVVVRYYKYMSTWAEHRYTIKILNSMSDRDLKDIGLTRGNINYLIFREGERNGK